MNPYPTLLQTRRDGLGIVRCEAAREYAAAPGVEEIGDSAIALRFEQLYLVLAPLQRRAQGIRQSIRRDIDDRGIENTREIFGGFGCIAHRKTQPVGSFKHGPSPA